MENSNWRPSNTLRNIEGMPGLKDQVIQIKSLLMAWAEVSLDDEKVKLLKERFNAIYNQLATTENQEH